ncbi:hypothetical protein GUJ93_ZPchr0012g18914 [Zizania palustris]|uniref:Uncharacterized protein n=1 Tax=Zizania palustris TaxID=103762 RepID=A0A8J6BV12_ZIZPA|nr:hypothetical protein GUJ93_ZPchr0012g18914 [Zizania palustris]
MAAAGGEPQKKLLSIIRDFAAEKSHGERRVSDLKRRLDDVRAASDAAAAELEDAKRAREEAEQELRGSQVQAAIVDASIQALEATISNLQEEISKVGSDLDALKSKGDIERDEFISQMHELNTKIRQFQHKVSVELKEEKFSELPSAEGQHVRDNNETLESEGILKDLIDKVNNVDTEVHVLEEEYQKDLLDHDKLRQELADIQAKRALMEAVMGEMKQLQELGEYPFFPSVLSPVFELITCARIREILVSNISKRLQKLSLTGSKRTAEMEKEHASLAEELQRQYACPGCGVNNMVGLEEAAS